ncbi:uncharacterized protein LOC113799538 isoform X2 [Dermatophagoides pteronyssinus]|uniref:uncharacterized protein LOC113799538 isoform X2 n=1 Tax=Dermatophagoides pteronyssinus TaxID=6956 RepID=UPI003F677887
MKTTKSHKTSKTSKPLKSSKYSTDAFMKNFLNQLKELFKIAQQPTPQSPTPMEQIMQQQQLQQLQQLQPQKPLIKSNHATVRSDFPTQNWDPNYYQRMIMKRSYPQTKFPMTKNRTKNYDERSQQYLQPVINIQIPIKNVVRHHRKEQRRMRPKHHYYLSEPTSRVGPGVVTKLCEKIPQIIRENLKGYREHHHRSPRSRHRGSIVERRRNPISPLRLNAGGGGGGVLGWSPYHKALDPWMRQPTSNYQQRSTRSRRNKSKKYNDRSKNGNSLAEENFQESYLNINFDNE